MNITRKGAEEQTTPWNGVSGHAWVDLQGALDQMFKPFEDLLVAAVAAGSKNRVLDVGCGTGATTLAVARSVGEGGRAVGIDISAPMLSAARARAQAQGVAAGFIQANAQDYPFERAAFDLIISRFGVMFFDDPVAAFANLRGAVTADGEMRLIAWRSPAENPFMTAAERAAAPFLPSLPARRPDAPGQFAFADRGRVERILTASGWTEIEIAPLDVACAFSETELLRYVTRLGPLGQIIDAADKPTQTKVLDAVRAAFETYVHGAEVRFTAACWTVGARAATRV